MNCGISNSPTESISFSEVSCSVINWNKFSGLTSLGHGALALALVVIYVSFKYYQRRRLLIELRNGANHWG